MDSYYPALSSPSLHRARPALCTSTGHRPSPPPPLTLKRPLQLDSTAVLFASRPCFLLKSCSGQTGSVFSAETFFPPPPFQIFANFPLTHHFFVTLSPALFTVPRLFSALFPNLRCRCPSSDYRCFLTKKGFLVKYTSSRPKTPLFPPPFFTTCPSGPVFFL